MQNNHNYPYSALNQQEAEHIATSALLYLVQDKELLGHFLSASGLGPHSIRKAAQDPDFLIGVLEYLMENETALLAYAKSQKLRPTMIVAAHYILAKKWNEQ